jgi:hypothetical protein
MTLPPLRRGLLGATLFAGVLFAAALTAPAQDDRGLQPGERKVDPVDLPLDKPGIWTLNFRYKPPRIKTVDGFDKNGNPAKQTVWYMWYQVYNRSGEPVYCIPEFELVTRDLNTRHLDEPSPYIFEQIKKFEDGTITKDLPEGKLNLLSTIEMSRRPIPVSKPEGYPRLISGLAIWTDMGEKAPRTNSFSVYVSGLSNGVATEQTKPVGPDKQPVTLIKKKTLRLDFIRPTDDARQQITDIRPDNANGPSETWVYRTATRLPPKGKK